MADTKSTVLRCYCAIYLLPHLQSASCSKMKDYYPYIKILIKWAHANEIVCSCSVNRAFLYSIPGDIERGVNETVTVECQTNTGHVRWRHCSVDSGLCTSINVGDLIDSSYATRFTLNDNCTYGQCCLTIHDVQGQDAGEYCCIEKDGRGEKKCFNLTVITGESYSTNNWFISLLLFVTSSSLLLFSSISSSFLSSSCSCRRHNQKCHQLIIGPIQIKRLHTEVCLSRPELSKRCQQWRPVWYQLQLYVRHGSTHLYSDISRISNPICDLERSGRKSIAWSTYFWNSGRTQNKKRIQSERDCEHERE